MRKFRKRYQNTRKWGFPRNQAFTIAFMAIWNKDCQKIADATIGDTVLGMAVMLSALSETKGTSPLELLDQIMQDISPK